MHHLHQMLKQWVLKYEKLHGGRQTDVRRFVNHVLHISGGEYVTHNTGFDAMLSKPQITYALNIIQNINDTLHQYCKGVQLFLLTAENQDINAVELQDLRHCILEYPLDYALPSLKHIMLENKAMLVLVNMATKKCLGSVTLEFTTPDTVEIQSQTRKSREGMGINSILRAIAIMILPKDRMIESIIANPISFLSWKDYTLENINLTFYNYTPNIESKQSAIKEINEHMDLFKSGVVYIPITKTNRNIAQHKVIQKLQSGKFKTICDNT